MRCRFSALAAACAAIILSVANAACAHQSESTVGFQLASAPDQDDRPLRLGIWYPSEASAQPNDVGPYRLVVAMDGAPSGHDLPLIVMSHGTGGSLFDAAELASGLARAGFVVVAVMHNGDNYQDRSNSLSRRNFLERPRQISRTLDFMLGEWSGRAIIDRERIGIFGHSAGGTTSLIAVGGVFDWSRVSAYCQANVNDVSCRNAATRQRNSGVADAAAPPINDHDSRIRAAVVAAPALEAAFEPQGLANVSVPVQLWVASEDAIVPDAARFQSLLPTSAAYRLAPNAGHFSFLAPCSAALLAAAPVICSDPPGFDRAYFQSEFTRDVLRFFETNLRQ